MIIKDKNKRFLKNGFSSEWDSYKSNLHSNKDSINFYIERNEIDQTNDRTNNLYWEGMQLCGALFFGSFLSLFYEK